MFVPQQQQNLGRRFGTSKMHFSPRAYAAARSKAVVLLLLPLWDSVIVLCFVVCHFVFLSSVAVILMRNRELVALLNLSLWRLAVPWICLRFVIVVFLDHTHLLFSNEHSKTSRYV